MFKGAGYSVSVATPDYIGDYIPAKSRIRTSGPSLSKVLQLRKLLSNSYEAIERSKPDIIITHNFDAGLLSKYIKKASIPIIYIPHGLLEMELKTYFPSSLSAILSSLGKSLDSFILKNIDRVITLTDPAAEYISDTHDVSYVSVIPPPFESEEPDPVDSTNPERNSILYSGNPDGYQNIGAAFEAVMIARNELPDLKLLISTHSSLNRWYKIINQHFNKIDITIYTPKNFQDSLLFARNADLALITRIDPYGFPMKIHYYVKCGLPIVAFDCAWAGFVDEQTALLAKPQDSKSLAEKLIQAYRNPKMRNELARNAYKKFAQDYNSDYILSEFEKIFAEF
ncbi:MAG: glycosyltransferase [candidate division Zixibacteria bacterium]|nr:glycosyltransferase [candidate division Zixibacteria bacterium]